MLLEQSWFLGDQRQQRQPHAQQPDHYGNCLDIALHEWSARSLKKPRNVYLMRRFIANNKIVHFIIEYVC